MPGTDQQIPGAAERRHESEQSLRKGEGVARVGYPVLKEIDPGGILGDHILSDVREAV